MFDDSAYRAGDIMTRDVATVRPETSLRRVVRILAERRIGGLPVVDDAGALVGMITEGDLIRWDENFPAQEEHWLETLGEGFEVAPAYLEALRAERHSVRHIMRAGPVVTVAEDMPLHAIASLMHEKGIKRVPVMRDGLIVGIVSRSDLVRMLSRWLDEQEARRRRGALPEPVGERPVGEARRAADRGAPPARLPELDSVDAVLGMVDPGHWSHGRPRTERSGPG